MANEENLRIAPTPQGGTPSRRCPEMPYARLSLEGENERLHEFMAAKWPA